MAGEDSGGGGADSRIRQVVHDTLWRPTGELARVLPATPAAGEARPLVGGVCAGVAARRGRRPTPLRWTFALTLLPALLYPLFWLVRLSGRPQARGREQANRQLFLVVVAVVVAVVTMAELADASVTDVAAFVAAVTTGASLMALARAPLLVWRLMTVVLLLVPFLPTEGDGSGVPFSVTGTVAYLLVLYVTARQHERRIVYGVGGCCLLLVVLLSALLGVGLGGIVLAALAVTLPMLAGDNVRLRRESTGAFVRTPAREPRTVVESDRSPIPVLDSVIDSVWRAPTRRPGGPVRLLRGPRRPVEGRVIAGVCRALSGDSPHLLLLVRVAFVVVLSPLGGILLYLLLWLLLPREDDPSAEDSEDNGDPVPLTAREVTAWVALAALSAGVAALTATQLSNWHQLPVLPSVVLAVATGMPFVLLPYAPLLTWRLMAGGVFATLVAVASAAHPPNALWPWPVPLLLALPVVLYAVAVDHPGRIATGVGVVTVVAGILAAFVVSGTPLAQTAWIAGVAVAVLLFGHNVRGRRAAQRQLARESALRRQDRARQAMLEERSRVARELHDVVSHHMSMIAIQAEAAPYKYAELTPEAESTFHTIRDAARDALSEMRRVVGLLREDGESADHAPQPGLERLADLVVGARQAGMEVRLDVDVAGPQLPSAVDVSAYRIVQESLSNAGRHAPGARVSVDITRGPRSVRVRVVNGHPAGGPAAVRVPAEPGGHGLVGMRERVAVLGGSLRVGPVAGGGFRVDAELPLASG